MRIIAFDSSTEWCSVAVGDGERWLQHEEAVGQTHSTRLLPMIDALLTESGWRLSDIEGLAFGAGPGSFTGVRIGCGVAQGLALGLDCPVLPVSTLAAIAQSTQCAGNDRRADRVLVCTDARMGEVYTAAYRREGTQWEEVSPPVVVSPAALMAPSSPGTWTGAGNGFAAYPALAARLGLRDVRPLLRATGRSIGELALRGFVAGEGVDAKDALPAYVRDRVALTTTEREAGRTLSALS
ncbi:MAG: tRNA (adenosine(37)-N6)-threonylcarbamoyltransferase complex dimerization subunit type 1 TsaB [Betaproteobacteria bacterium]